MKRFIFMLAFAIFSTSVFAESEQPSGVTGGSFYLEMTTQNNTNNNQIVRNTAYVDGAFTAYREIKLVCPPAGTTNGQVYATLIKWLGNNPEQWNYSLVALMTEVFVPLWPCPKGSKK